MSYYNAQDGHTTVFLNRESESSVGIQVENSSMTCSLVMSNINAQGMARELLTLSRASSVWENLETLKQENATLTHNVKDVSDRLQSYAMQDGQSRNEIQRLKAELKGAKEELERSELRLHNTDVNHSRATQGIRDELELAKAAVVAAHDSLRMQTLQAPEYIRLKDAYDAQTVDLNGWKTTARCEMNARMAGIGQLDAAAEEVSDLTELVKKERDKHYAMMQELESVIKTLRACNDMQSETLRQRAVSTGEQIDALVAQRLRDIAEELAP